MQSPFDTFAKGLIEAALSPVCDVRIEEPVAADELYSDAFVVPRAPIDQLAARGLLGRIASRRCSIEAYSSRPTLYEVDRSIARASLVRARERRSSALWIIAALRPGSVLRAWRLQPDRSGLDGLYASRVRRAPRVIVCSELPATRETLLVRLMGRGETLQTALANFHRLPLDAWERAFVPTLLLRVRSELERMTASTEWRKDELVRYQQMKEEFDRFMADAIAQGRAEGEARGRAEGEARGRAEGEADALRTVLVSRGFEIDSRTEHRISECHDVAVLRAWVARAVNAATLDAVFDTDAPR